MNLNLVPGSIVAIYGVTDALNDAYYTVMTLVVSSN